MTLPPVDEPPRPNRYEITRPVAASDVTTENDPPYEQPADRNHPVICSSLAARREYSGAVAPIIRPVTTSRRVDDVYPVLKQWAFIAHERAELLRVAIERFFAARRALNQARLLVARESWSSSLVDESLAYESALYRIQGESYFLMSAASHLVRILDSDPQLGRLPSPLHEQVRQLRNVLEHWDEWTADQTAHGGETSAARLREADPEIWPFGFKFQSDGDFVVGSLIPLAKLQEALTAIWLRQISPSLSPPHPRPLGS